MDPISSFGASDVLRPKNIAAYTKPDFPLPPFLSINRMGDGLVGLTVRDVAGVQSQITITDEAWSGVVQQIKENEDGHD